jgi:hypothetical protein
MKCLAIAVVIEAIRTVTRAKKISGNNTKQALNRLAAKSSYIWNASHNKERATI